MKGVLSFETIAPMNLVPVRGKVADRLVPLMIGRVNDPAYGQPFRNPVRLADRPLETQLAINQAHPSCASYDLTSAPYLYLEAHALLDPWTQEKNVSSKVRL
jgi:hypothetical protein